MPRRKARLTNVYVDGFNLYYGSLLKNPALKWLDLAALAQGLMPQERIHRVRYFSAHVSGARDPAAPARQGKYLRALGTLPNVTVQMGTFLSKDISMHLAPPPLTGAEPWLLYLRPHGKRYAWVSKTEEKGSDVNLATALLADAFDGDCELAMVISNDSDLMEPIRLVRQRFYPVGVVNPHKTPSVELKKVSSWQVRLFPNLLRRSQFAAQLTDGSGTFDKPVEWS